MVLSAAYKPSETTPPLKSQNMAKKCVYCEKELIGRKLKYCDNACRYRFTSINNEKVKKFSVSQHLRVQPVDDVMLLLDECDNAMRRDAAGL